MTKLARRSKPLTLREMLKTLKEEGFEEIPHSTDSRLILLKNPNINYGFVYNREKDTWTLVNGEVNEETATKSQSGDQDSPEEIRGHQASRL